MKIQKTGLDGLFILETDQFEDERGYLAKFYDENFLAKNNLKLHITQVKFVYTKKKGTIRGIHMQKKPYEEVKIVHCTRGKIYEVALDVRKNSKTFGKWFGAEFSEKDKKSFLIPKGFAHGYQTLTNDSELLYLMTGKFSLPHNIGFKWDDPYLGINWPLNPTVIADKDRKWTLLKK